MVKRLFVLLCLVMAGMAVGGNLQAVKCTAVPVLDGKLDDECWKSALVFSDFKILNTKNKAIPASVYLLYDESALYVGCRATVPAGGKVIANAKTNSGGVFSDDCFEILVDANATATRYLQFCINPNGKIASNLFDQGGFVHEPVPNTAEAAGSIGEGYWSCEVRIPYCDLDILPGSKTFGFNFAHGARNPYEDSSVAENGIFHNASAFIKVDGIDAKTDSFIWELTSPALSVSKAGDKLVVNPSFSVMNLAGMQQEVEIDAVLLGKSDDDKPIGIGGSTARRIFKAGERSVVSLPQIFVDKPGNFRCVVSISDPATKRLLKRKSFKQRLSFAPFSISVKLPAYRNLIFASQELKKVNYLFSSSMTAAELKGAKLTTGILDEKGAVLMSKSVDKIGEMVEFPADKLPEQRMKIFVKAEKGGKVIGESTARLRKLPFQAGEVWRDEYGIWHVEKEPFFMIGCWGDVKPEGANATVHKSDVYRLERSIVYEKNFINMTRYSVLSADDCEYIKTVFAKMAKIPNLFAHYVVDEPEISGCTVMALKQMRDLAIEVDPYHPLICSNDTVGGLKNFYECADINGLHPYPPPSREQPRNQFERVIMFMDQAMAFMEKTKEPQTIAFLQQGFNYGDCGAANTCIPTFDETRTQYLISLAMGGNGILFFNFCTEHYYENSIGHPEVAKEMRAITPVMTTPDLQDAAIKCNNDKIRFRVKRVGSEYWVLACSTTKEPQTATFTIPGVGNRKMQVFREGRTLNSKAGSFQDSFNNFDARIYTTDTRTFGLRTLAEVDAEINRLNESRRKPGNLAFQMYEHDKLKLYASSNYWGSRTPDSALWHVTDGIMGGLASRSGNSNGKMTWIDKTKGVCPDWIVLEFPEEVNVGRIVVYPAVGSIKDYEVQVEENGTFRTVGKVAGLTDKWDVHQEFKFPQVKTRKVRLYVTANNGDTTKVHEIEVYEK